MENRIEIFYQKFNQKGVFFKFLFWLILCIVFLILIEILSFTFVSFVDKKLVIQLNEKYKSHSEIYSNLQSPLSIIKNYKKFLFEVDDSYHWKYVPYLSWRNHPYKGEFINVSEDGIRKTINYNENNSDALKIFCFGGSSTFGYLNPDSWTWSSQLSKLLNQKEKKYNVYNYGENGYTFDQNIHNLIDLLKKGKIPDYVLFFVGHNESLVWLYPGFTPGYPGAYQEYEKSVSIIKNKKLFPFVLNLFYLFDKLLTKYSFNYKLLIHLFQISKKNTLTNSNLKQVIFDENYVHTTSIDLNEETIRYYSQKSALYFMNYVRILKSLSNEYEFKIYIGLQPNIYTTHKRLSSWEKNQDRYGIFAYDEIRDKLKTDKFLYDSILNKKQILEVNIVDLRDLFDSIEEAVFLDDVHLTLKGNKVVAEYFYKLITDHRP